MLFISFTCISSCWASEKVLFDWETLVVLFDPLALSVAANPPLLLLLEETVSTPPTGELLVAADEGFITADELLLAFPLLLLPLDPAIALAEPRPSKFPLNDREDLHFSEPAKSTRLRVERFMTISPILSSSSMVTNSCRIVWLRDDS